ncbi:hypothetical protein GCM10009828_046290 [Actinoplanes couchii]|uniref:Uncharacterized protein n=1 Tax=Actinoplanes couchii TaxID=403638 RepID=A0ABQ3X6W3_9ACTN|nr:hypothetical protein Aco03nite_026560 [Actinoplanes couchii]
MPPAPVMSQRSPERPVETEATGREAAPGVDGGAAAEWEVKEGDAEGWVGIRGLPGTSVAPTTGGSRGTT